MIDIVRKRSFAPIVDQRTRLLILGSLPGEQSLARQQYYGHPQNRFWQLMSEVVGIDLVPMDYSLRLRGLLQCGVGLWDVVGEANRAGSLDSAIRDHDSNDLAGLLERFPSIAAIAFNGGTAYRLGLQTLGPLKAKYRLINLPSSSPAYTLAYEHKLRRWMVLREPLCELPDVDNTREPTASDEKKP